jgi:hypothetical protein
MPKIDLKKQLKHLYNPSAKQVVTVDVPPMNFLMIDGAGAPESQAFQDAIEALYAVSFALKFGLKLGRFGKKTYDYPVMPLEGLWWADRADAFITQALRDTWQWTLMIMQPEFITPAMVEATREEVARKKNPAALPGMRFETFHEGLAVQIMHIGPFATEGSTIQRLHHAIAQSGHQPRGKHHEIYLSDFRRAAPEKLKTVLRQPMG